MSILRRATTGWNAHVILPTPYKVVLSDAQLKVHCLVAGGGIHSLLRGLNLSKCLFAHNVVILLVCRQVRDYPKYQSCSFSTNQINPVPIPPTPQLLDMLNRPGQIGLKKAYPSRQHSSHPWESVFFSAVEGGAHLPKDWVLRHCRSGCSRYHCESPFAFPHQGLDIDGRIFLRGAMRIEIKRKMLVHSVL